MLNWIQGGRIAALQMWQQQFAWTESGKEAKLVARASALPSTDKLAQQPLFCVETMMHLLYFSCLVYDYKRVRHSHIVAAVSQMYMYTNKHWARPTCDQYKQTATIFALCVLKFHL